MEISKSFIIFLITISLFPKVQASDLVARLAVVSGNAFMMKEGKLIPSKSNSDINSGSELFVEEGAQAGLVDFFQKKIYVSASSQVKFLKDVYELKEGYLWIQSSADDGVDKKSLIRTANAEVEFGDGDFVVSYDNLSGKTQVLVIAGSVYFYSLVNKDMRQEVTAGKFSFVEQSYEDGVPREPTNVGVQSFKKIMALFGGVNPLDKNSLVAFDTDKTKVEAAPGRKIASVEAEITAPTQAPEKKKGEVIFIQTTISEKDAELPSSLDYYHQLNNGKGKHRIHKATKSESKDKVDYNKLEVADVRVKVFQGNKSKVASTPGEATENTRIPSSLSEETKVPADFEQSLRGHYQKQQKHSGEVNTLIDRLKSYNQDYEKEH